MHVMFVKCMGEQKWQWGTWDIDEGGVHLTTLGDETLYEGGAPSAPHPGQADFNKL